MSETLSNLTQRLSLIESDVVALSKAEQRTNVSSSMVSFSDLCDMFFVGVCCCVDDLPHPHVNSSVPHLRDCMFVLSLTYFSFKPYNSSLKRVAQGLQCVLGRVISRVNLNTSSHNGLLTEMTNLSQCCRWSIR